jgi:HK97 family phage major capsid protein
VEGAPSIVPDNQALSGEKTLLPKNFAAILLVSERFVSLGAINIEAELLAVFADMYGRTFQHQILTGDGTGQNFKGLFPLIPALPDANKVIAAEAGIPKIADLLKLALKIADFTDNAVIIMNPLIFEAIMGDASVGTDALKIGIYTTMSILGVKIILTSAVPESTSEGAVVAVAGDLSRYALAMASEIEMEPIRALYETQTYFRASLFAAGAPIIDNEFFGLVTANEPLINAGE